MCGIYLRWVLYFMYCKSKTSSNFRQEFTLHQLKLQQYLNNKQNSKKSFKLYYLLY